MPTHQVSDVGIGRHGDGKDVRADAERLEVASARPADQSAAGRHPELPPVAGQDADRAGDVSLVSPGCAAVRAEEKPLARGNPEAALRGRQVESLIGAEARADAGGRPRIAAVVALRQAMARGGPEPLAIEDNPVHAGRDGMSHRRGGPGLQRHPDLSAVGASEDVGRAAVLDGRVEAAQPARAAGGAFAQRNGVDVRREDALEPLPLVALVAGLVKAGRRTDPDLAEIFGDGADFRAGPAGVPAAEVPMSEVLVAEAQPVQRADPDAAAAGSDARHGIAKDGLLAGRRGGGAGLRRAPAAAQPRLGLREFHSGPAFAAVVGPHETAVRSGPDAAVGIAAYGGDHVREEIVAAELREALPLSVGRRCRIRRRQRERAGQQERRSCHSRPVRLHRLLFRILTNRRLLQHVSGGSSRELCRRLCDFSFAAARTAKSALRPRSARPPRNS